VDKELKELKEEMFRQSQVLFRASQGKSNVIAEINGAEAALKNLQAKIRKLDADTMKQRELIYQADYATQVLERKVAWAQGQRSDEEKAILTAQIQDLTVALEKQTRDHTMLNQQVKRLEEDLRRATHQIAQHAKENESLSSKIADLKLSNENALRQMRQATGEKEDLAVSHDVLKLEVKRLRDILNSRQDEVFGLTNRRYQLQCTIEERTREIQVHCDMLRAELKVLQEDGHKVALELKERQVKVEKLRAKFESIVGVRGGNPDEESEHTQAFCIVQAAQQKQQLEKQGDELDALIKQKMEEVRKLENTMRLLQAKNTEYRQSFHKADESSREFEQKQALEEQLKSATDRSKYKRRELGEVQQLIQFQQKTLADLEAERDVLLRNIQELDRRKQAIEKEIEAQGPKLERPQKQMLKLAKDHRRAHGVPEDQETAIERDFQLQELKETNQVVLASLVQLGKQYPDVAVYLSTLFEQHGIKVQAAPGSRPSSSRSQGPAASAR